MENLLKITVAQLNFWVGDIQRNLEKMLNAIDIAKNSQQSDLIVFPELALSGYPPDDLLFRPELHQRIQLALQEIAAQAEGIDILLGYPQKKDNQLYNAAIWFRNKTVLADYQKQKLPNYGVFDEERYFTPGTKPCVVQIKNVSIGVLICEDIWFPEPVAATVKAGAECILCLNASPFNLNKTRERESIILQRIAEQPVSILYVHGVGGQDELIFDGGTTLFDKQGHLCQRAPFFQESLPNFAFENNTPQLGEIAPYLSEVESAYQALILGVKDYVRKNYFSDVVLGLSGGIDSALTLAIAVDALGSEHVQAVFMPSRYTTDMSREDALWQASHMGVEFLELSIEPAFEAFLQILSRPFANYSSDVTEENLQARCRGMILMAISNKTGRLVLTTGNKSEMAVGFSTLYGDMAGGLDVLKDVSKTMVYRLAHYRNQQQLVIPERVLERPPSAELAPDQRDEDTLPPYNLLDEILTLYVEQHCSSEDIIERGYSEAFVKQTITRLHRNEYKRRQAPPGIRITGLAFGRDWRYPITSGF